MLINISLLIVLASASSQLYPKQSKTPGKSALVSGSVARQHPVVTPNIYSEHREKKIIQDDQTKKDALIPPSPLNDNLMPGQSALVNLPRKHRLEVKTPDIYSENREKKIVQEIEEMKDDGLAYGKAHRAIERPRELNDLYWGNGRKAIQEGRAKKAESKVITNGGYHFVMPQPGSFRRKQATNPLVIPEALAQPEPENDVSFEPVLSELAATASSTVMTGTILPVEETETTSSSRVTDTNDTGALGTMTPAPEVKITSTIQEEHCSTEITESSKTEETKESSKTEENKESSKTEEAKESSKTEEIKKKQERPQKPSWVGAVMNLFWKGREWAVKDSSSKPSRLSPVVEIELD